MAVSMLISSAQAVVVSVTADPDVVPHPGGSTTIRVFASDAGVGSVTIFTPITHTSSVALIDVPAGGADSVVYPDDFPGGSTEEIGKYEVMVYLAGQEWQAAFWVTFIVIPESSLGTIVAVVASFGALIGLVKVKRVRKIGPHTIPA